MQILSAIWNFFATYILQKAPYMVGFLTLVGYCLMGKKWYDTLAGTLKAIIGIAITRPANSGREPRSGHASTTFAFTTAGDMQIAGDITASAPAGVTRNGALAGVAFPAQNE